MLSIKLPLKLNRYQNLTVFDRHIALLTMGIIFSLMMIDAHAESLTQSESFGRLFSTPTERNRLDATRQTQILKLVNTPEDVIVDDVVMPTVLPTPITMQGYVKRSDGAKSTVWINNQAVQEGGEVNSVRIGNLQKNSTTSSQNLDVQIPANGQQVRLKAGQMYTPDTNQIIELKNVHHLSDVDALVQD